MNEMVKRSGQPQLRVIQGGLAKSELPLGREPAGTAEAGSGFAVERSDDLDVARGELNMLLKSAEPRIKALLTSALSFLDGHAAKAYELGWSPLACFGLPRNFVVGDDGYYLDGPSGVGVAFHCSRMTEYEFFEDFVIVKTGYQSSTIQKGSLDRDGDWVLVWEMSFYQQ